MEMIDGEPYSYLGDGVYAYYDGFGTWLRANHHTKFECTDEIYLEPEVLEALNNFNKDVKEMKKKGLIK